jgi:hypothetical protein
MKYKNKIISSFFLLTLALFSISCQKQQAGNSSSGVPSAPAVKAATPTEAFKILFAAVKAKDMQRIKQMMSKGTLAFAEGYAAQSKQTVDEALRNGFTGPALADSLPEMRDERVKDNFGAVEVFNPKENRWEDLPFVLEDGGWKLAVGDVFQDTYKKPGKSIGEMETKIPNVSDFPTNVSGNQKMPPIPNANNPVQGTPKK